MAECKQCGQLLPADAVGGACPACLLGLARVADPNAALGETRDRDAAGSPVWFPPAAELDERFPQFQVEALIGQGGMGAVYKAHQPSLDRPVAIKIMSPRFADDPTFAERFSREARTMARLNHQNIVNVYDFGSVAGLYYLVMEYVEGVNLRLAMKAGQLDSAQALAIVPQVCEALQFAHDAGIVHRDIKPENILVDRRGRVKIADFGLAKLVAEEDAQQWTLTGSRQVLGTLNYMAPEQIERPASVDHRADIYSLGVVLYELLTGELPLGRFQLPGEKHAGHAALDQVVARSLDKAPENRFQQASEFRTAVETARQSSGFRPLGPAGENQAVPVAKAFAPAASSEPRHPRVSFVIENPWHGMTVTHGVLKATGEGLLVDYAKRETIFQQPLADQGQHVLPYGGILKAEFREGWYSHTVMLEMDSPAAHKGLPSEKPGTLSFSIAAKDRDDARCVVNAIRTAIGQPLIVVRPEKPEEARANARRRLGWPAAGMMLAGLINLLLVPVVFGLLFLLPASTVEFLPPASQSGVIQATDSPAETPAMVSGMEGEESIRVGDVSASDAPDFAPAPDQPQKSEGNAGVPVQKVQPVDPKGTMLPAWGVILGSALTIAWFLMGGFFISAGYCMASLQKWGWCLAMAIVAVIPIHPGWILGLPSGIVALVQLSRPSNREQFSRDRS